MKKMTCFFLYLILFTGLLSAFELKVMSKNVLFKSLNDKSLPALAQQIKQSDIAGCQEFLKRSMARKVAKETGYHLVIQEGMRAIFSKYPVIKTTPKKEGVLIQLPNGEKVWFFNLHLPSGNYGPYVLNNVAGQFGSKVLDFSDPKQFASFCEQQRLSRIGDGEGIRFISDFMNAQTGDLPVFVTGDFNAPSHLDWTPEAVKKGLFPVVVDWPASKKMAELGFLDSFRVLNPDPITMPGFTWTCDPAWQTNINHSGETIVEPFDRIDFAYYKGDGVNPVKALIYGPMWDDKCDIQTEGFFSDHRSLLVTFSLSN